MAAAIQQCRKTFFRTDTHMVVALRTNILGLVEIAVKDHFPAAGTFAPQILRRTRASHQPFNAGTNKIGDPIHK